MNGRNWGLLDDHQRAAVRKLESGSILCGGVGSGKSRTAIAYWLEEYEERSLYVITTPHKRDTHDWNKELGLFGVKGRYTVDSWNNIEKYLQVQHAFFIFDEQRIVGKGVWAKTFIKICRNDNAWIVLTATPGDVWKDYWAIFVANGFYKNWTDFERKHIVYSRVARYPKIDGYRDQDVLEKFRDRTTILLEVQKKTRRHASISRIQIDLREYDELIKARFNKKTGEPFEDSSQLFYALRRACNDVDERFKRCVQLWRKHKKVIIFYNFDYELERLRAFNEITIVREWNGHKHENVPKSEHYVYLVQYVAGAEAWECTDCDAMIFYSLNYSYKIMEQCCGRIDRRNSTFLDLYYYVILSNAPLDSRILKALSRKRNFNERKFLETFVTKL